MSDAVYCVHLEDGEYEQGPTEVFYRFKLRGRTIILCKECRLSLISAMVKHLAEVSEIHLEEEDE